MVVHTFIPALVRQWQVNYSVFEPNLVYTEGSKTVKAICIAKCCLKHFSHEHNVVGKTWTMNKRMITDVFPNRFTPKMK